MESGKHGFFQVLGRGAFALLAFLLKLLGGWDAALGLLLLLMGLDLVSGVFLSFLHKSGQSAGGGFLSRALFLGLSRKLLMLVLVMVGAATDGLMGTQIARLSVIGFYAANEALSVVENAALCGVPFPKGLLSALERFRDSRDTGDKEV